MLAWTYVSDGMICFTFLAAKRRPLRYYITKLGCQLELSLETLKRFLNNNKFERRHKWNCWQEVLQVKLFSMISYNQFYFKTPFSIAYSFEWLNFCVGSISSVALINSVVSKFAVHTMKFIFLPMFCFSYFHWLKPVERLQLITCSLSSL